MKANFVVAVMIVTIGLLVPQHALAEIYYHLDGTVSLVKSNAFIAVQHDSTAIIPGAYNFRTLHAAIADTGMVRSLDRGFHLYPIEEGFDYDSASAEASSDEYVNRVVPVYLMENDGTEVGVTDMITVQFEDGVSSAEALETLEAYGLHFVDSCADWHNLWWVALDDSVNGSPLPYANELHSDESTSWAVPSMHMQISQASLPSDGYFPHQYYLRDTASDRDMDADSAWLFPLADSGILVAVIDDGVKSHLDLPSARIAFERDFYYGDTISEPGRYQNHGMACAGIIGATHNDTGIAGIHGSCTIVPIDIFANSVGLFGAGANGDSIAKAVYYAYSVGARVVSNSWGYFTTNPYTPLQAAIRNVSDRCDSVGDGLVMVFASHNHEWDSLPFPANMSEVITVGAVDRSDTRWIWSNTGGELDLVTPSGENGLNGDLWTIDQQSADSGWNQNPFLVDVNDANGDGDYTYRMGGTSGACPQVAGIAALVLSKRTRLNSCTTYVAVRQVLTESAIDLGTAGPDTVYGYGRANAFRAMVAISRGDLNTDGVINVLDVVALISEAFRGGAVPAVHAGLSDMNCDGVKDVVDVVGIVDVAFRGEDEPPPCFEYNY